MSSVASDICADFLVEVGEILDQLGEQMVALERAPADRECLNAVFRGFHTIKGGAGFLNLPPLVEAPAVADLPEPKLISGGRYFGTTVSGDWLDRVVARGLGARSSCRLNLSGEGLDVIRLAGSFRIPAAALRGRPGRMRAAEYGRAAGTASGAGGPHAQAAASFYLGAGAAVAADGGGVTLRVGHQRANRGGLVAKPVVKDRS